MFHFIWSVDLIVLAFGSIINKFGAKQRAFNVFISTCTTIEIEILRRNNKFIIITI